MLCKVKYALPFFISYLVSLKFKIKTDLKNKSVSNRNKNGNYGMISSDCESKKPWVSAYIVREKCDEPSNFRSEGRLDTYLKENNIVRICSAV